MVTVGLDLHKRYITACALDALGAVRAEHRQLEPSLDGLCQWLEALGQPVLVAMEATLYWHWLERQLTAPGFTLRVTHPYQVKLTWQARTKTDPLDARKLAELARVNLLPSIWIPDPATRALRQLLRGRVFLVRQQTVMRNRIYAYLTAENLRCPELDLYSKAGRRGWPPWNCRQLSVDRSDSCWRITRCSPRRFRCSIATSSPPCGAMRPRDEYKPSLASVRSERGCCKPRLVRSLALRPRRISPPTLAWSRPRRG
jgi:hypothetical protein